MCSPRGAGQAVGSGPHWKAKPLAGGLPESRAPLGLGTSRVFRNKATLGNTLLRFVSAAMHQAPAVSTDCAEHWGGAQLCPDGRCGLGLVTRSSLSVSGACDPYLLGGCEE